MPQDGWSGSELVTGEAVALDLRTAALPSRAVAAGVDLLLQLLAVLGLGLLAQLASLDTTTATSAAIGVLVTVLVLVVYHVAPETLFGRTPGKMVMGLRVVRDDGGPIGFRQALARGLSSGFLEKPGLTFFVLPVVVSLLNARSKRVGDLLAGTVVLQERVAQRSAPAPDMPPPLAAWASTLEMSGLSDQLALSVRSFLARTPQLTDTAREQLGGRLVTAVRQVTAPPPPLGTPGWAYLSAVLAERRRRETERLSPTPQLLAPPPVAPPVVAASVVAYGGPEHSGRSSAEQPGGRPEPPAPAGPTGPTGPTQPRPGGFAPPS